MLESVALLAMLRHMASQGQAPGAPQPVLANMAGEAYVLMAGFGLSIPVFFAAALDLD